MPNSNKILFYILFLCVYIIEIINNKFQDAEIARLREELSAARNKLSSWEESMTQARTACEAWKKEAAVAIKKAEMANKEKEVALAKATSLQKDVSLSNSDLNI